MKYLKFQTVKGWKSYSYIEFEESESETTIIKIIGMDTIKRIFKSRNQNLDKKESWNIEEEIKIIDLNENEKLVFIDDRLTIKEKLKM